MAAPNQQNHLVLHSHSSHNRDIFSNMPDDVVERIASFLPIKESHKLSILSKRFRFFWRFCCDLSFDRSFAQNLSKDECKNIVNYFFHYHLNPEADRLRLYFDANDEIALVSYWIARAGHLGINELELDFTPSDQLFTLYYDLIDYESITIMKLVNCELYLPVTSNGLRHLRDLTLERVGAHPTLIHVLFVNGLALRRLQLINCCFIYHLDICPKGNFKSLVVKNCSDVYSITINAPHLCTLHYLGKICEFKFEHTELLELNDVVIDIRYPRRYQLLSHRRDIMRSLACVKSLSVSSTFLEGLCARFAGNEYREFEFYLLKLKKFHLVVSGQSYLNPSDIINFLRKCPKAESVLIDLEPNAFANSIYWDFYGRKCLNDCGILFPFLSIVKVKGFALKELPMMMVRFFLRNAIYLRHLVIVKAKHHNCPQDFAPECLRWGIASSAKIEIFDYMRDRSA